MDEMREELRRKRLSMILAAGVFLVVAGVLVFSPAAHAASGPTNCCVGDLNCDAQVNFLDLIIIKEEWGECADCISNLNGDEFVNFEDLGILKSHFFGQCLVPPPTALTATPPRLFEELLVDPQVQLASNHRYALAPADGEGGIKNLFVSGDGQMIGPEGAVNPESLRGYVPFVAEHRDEYMDKQTTTYRLRPQCVAGRACGCTVALRWISGYRLPAAHATFDPPVAGPVTCTQLGIDEEALRTADRVLVFGER